jgi:phage host-nuclease inhibitor protein Gam
MSKTMKVKSESTGEVPQSKEQVSEAIGEIGRLQRERQRLETAMNDEMALIKARYEAEAGPHGDRIKVLTRGVQAWCEAHRAELTTNGKTKTVALADGEVRWRTCPPRVTIKAQDVVLATLRRLGLTQFIRAKEEVNKEALLLEPEAASSIKGITISQKEEFIIVPHESQLEEVV